MSCERYTAAIVDHACGAEIAADAAAHLAVCTTCRRTFDEQLRLLLDVDRHLQTALDIEPSTPFVRNVMARARRSAQRRRQAAWWGAPAAAAALMLVTFAVPRESGRQAARRHDSAVPSSVSSVPVERTPTNPETPGSGSAPGARSRLAGPRPRVDRQQVAAVRRNAVGTADGVLTPQDRAIAKYLDLVRQGVLDTSGLARGRTGRPADGGSQGQAPDEAGLRPPALVIEPVSIDPLGIAEVQPDPPSASGDVNLDPVKERAK
ncbi:MAG TPA: hypothetical protein VD833_07535 [Vicinamibacterales bacterium]|nr:hypothetical protein [Vicinamibacterales bacterium]